MLDPVLIDKATRGLMRDGGKFVDTGWYGMDDNHRPQIGPFATKEQCQKACDEINANE